MFSFIYDNTVENIRPFKIYMLIQMTALFFLLNENTLDEVITENNWLILRLHFISFEKYLNYGGKKSQFFI